MPVHRLRFYLRLVLGCFGLAIVEVLVWGAFTPEPAVIAHEETADAAEETAIVQVRDLPQLRDFSRFWARRLRQPLYTDPAGQQRTTAPTRRNAPPSMAYKLLGTIMDGEQSAAIVSDRLGKQELKQMGDYLGAEETGPTIIEISEKQIVVDNRGQRVTLELEQPYSIEELLNAEPTTNSG